MYRVRGEEGEECEGKREKSARGRGTHWSLSTKFGTFVNVESEPRSIEDLLKIDVVLQQHSLSRTL